MFVISNLIYAIAKVLGIVLDFLMILIIIRALISWVNPDPYNPIVVFLHRVTEPILEPLRRLIPMHNVGIDISPIIAWLVILFTKAFFIKTLYQLADLMQ